MTRHWEYDTAGLRQDQRGYAKQPHDNSYDERTAESATTLEEYAAATTSAAAGWHRAHPPRSRMSTADIQKARQRMLEELGLPPADVDSDHQADGSNTVAGVTAADISGAAASGPATVYVMTMRGSQYVKVGITTRGEDRLSEHERNGYERFDEVEVRTLAHARYIEREILKMAERGDAMTRDVEALRPAMPQGGFTEVITLPAEIVATAIRNMATAPRRDSAE